MDQLKITTTENEQWFVLEFGYNKRFSDLLRDGIKPVQYRKWIKTKKHWQVHKNKLPLAVHFGRRFFNHVDYSDLAPDLQIWVVQRIEEGGWSVSASTRPATKLTPHQVLHLLPTAPQVVVKAAYKALVAVHHPDHGGDSDSFRAVQEAYEKLLQIKPL